VRRGGCRAGAWEFLGGRYGAAGMGCSLHLVVVSTRVGTWTWMDCGRMLSDIVNVKTQALFA